VTDFLEEHLDLGAFSQLLEVSFGDSHIGGGRGVHQVNGLWLISVVLVVGKGAPDFKWNVGAHSGDAKASMVIIVLSNSVRAVNLIALAQITVRSQLVWAHLTSDALACVPDAIVVLVAVDEFGVTFSLALTKVLNNAKHVAGNGFNIFDNLLHDHGLGVGILNSFVVHCLLGTI